MEVETFPTKASTFFTDIFKDKSWFYLFSKKKERFHCFIIILKKVFIYKKGKLSIKEQIQISKINCFSFLNVIMAVLLSM
jgi:outer membrane protein assembly factor BamE (lipoprotein component of BamABCDE complex)